MRNSTQISADGKVITSIEGNTREAVLWLLFWILPSLIGWIGWLLEAIGLIHGLFIPQDISMKDAQLRVVELSVIMLPNIALGLWFAKITGTSLYVLSDHVRAKMWYGAERSFPITAPVNAARRKAPFPHYVLRVGDQYLSLNLGRRKGEDENVESLVSLLAERAGEKIPYQRQPY